ncbi:hypothetical protein BCD64_08455 [Nostoc sp. MBR 210]|nr:hypothetical protein BCD64_08455 [Nostoc sp. MBR 210]
MTISNDEQAIAIIGLFFVLSCHTQMHYLKCQVIQWLIFDDIYLIDQLLMETGKKKQETNSCATPQRIVMSQKHFKDS